MNARAHSPRLSSLLAYMLVGCAAVLLNACPAFAASESAPSTQPTTAPLAASDLFSVSNLTAWCIVPYDGKHRGPADRAQMLERLGLNHFAYDWRGQHLPGFPTELDELAKRHIALEGVWFPDQLNNDARFILATLAAHNVKTQLWVTSWGYEKVEASRRVQAAVDRMRPIAEAAAKQGCILGLYNHNGWFGEPLNLIAISHALKAAGLTNVGIVYNLHHGYGDLDHFDHYFSQMMSDLIAVNLNGMSKIPTGTGEPVVPVGQGELDLTLLRKIRDAGYRGHIGIINESNEDAELRLRDNIKGVEWLARQLDGQEPGPRPTPKSWHAPIAR